MLRVIWPVSWWWAVGILKSHFLVFKRHPSLLGSDFLCSLTTIVQSVASQVLSEYVLRCFEGPFGCDFDLLRTNGRLLQPFLTAVPGERCTLSCHWPWLLQGWICFGQRKRFVLVGMVCWCLLILCFFKQTRMDEKKNSLYLISKHTCTTFVWHAWKQIFKFYSNYINVY